MSCLNLLCKQFHCLNLLLTVSWWEWTLCCTTDPPILFVRVFGNLICKGDYHIGPSSSSTLFTCYKETHELSIKSLYHFTCHSHIECYSMQCCHGKLKRNLIYFGPVLPISDWTIFFYALGLGEQFYLWWLKSQSLYQQWDNCPKQTEKRITQENLDKS